MKLSILHDGSVDKCHASAFNALIRYSDECKLFWNTGYTCKQDIHVNYKQVMLTILSSITFFSVNFISITVYSIPLPSTETEISIQIFKFIAHCSP